MGRGEKSGAHGAAVDAMRIVLDNVPMDGIVVIGEGEKDEAPMLYNGERIGDGSAIPTDVAVDPIDGTTLTALGRGNAIAVIAVSERGTMFDPGPCVYMEKIAVGPDGVGVIDITRSVAENIEALAKAKGTTPRDITAVVLDRDRHTDLIAEIRATGARIRLIPDGAVASPRLFWTGTGTPTSSPRSAPPAPASGSSPTATWPAPSPPPGRSPAPTCCSASAAPPRAASPPPPAPPSVSAAAPPRGASSPRPRSSAWAASSRAGCGPATTTSARRPPTPATTSSGISDASTRGA